MSPYVFARATASIRVNNHPYTIRIGEARFPDDPAVLAQPDLFSDVPTIVARYPGHVSGVEQTSAAPGERRASRRAD